MADIKDRRPGGGGASAQTVRYHDEGDGTWSEAEGAHTRYWNATTSTWDRVTGTGGLLNVNTVAGKTLKTASFSLTATGTVVAAVATKLIKVYAIKLVVSAAISVNWRDGATTALEGAQALAANGGYTEAVNPPAFLLATSAGNVLDLVISGAGTAAGRVSYWDDDTT